MVKTTSIRFSTAEVPVFTAIGDLAAIGGQTCRIVPVLFAAALWLTELLVANAGIEPTAEPAATAAIPFKVFLFVLSIINHHHTLNVSPSDA